MIEFRGEISENCRRYIVKKESKNARIGMAIVAGVFCVPIVILAITWHWIIVMAIPVLILSVILAGIPPKKNNYSLIIPERIVIDNDVIVSESKKFRYDRMIYHVKKIVDMGDWYHIFFYYRYRSPRFICEKDLITQGTIDEFEKIFQGKIVIIEDK